MPVSGLTTPEDALRFVERHGVVLVAAKGRAPRLTEAIAGERIKGSWWAHAQSHRIHALLAAVTECDDVLVCRLLDRKVTLVHRRLWPSLVRLSSRFRAEQLTRVREEHTPSGRHVNHSVPFPQWVPADVMEHARGVSEQDALAALRNAVPLQ